jgi:hypothetical protein
MANLNEKIQDLLKTTSSEEVKAVCTEFLAKANGKDVNPTDLIAESLFTNLKSYVDKDSKVGALLNEKEGFQQSIADIESQISRNAAQRLSENWDSVRKDKKVSNVGNLFDNTLKADNMAKAEQSDLILEKLSGLDDESAKKFVEKSKIDSYSIKESVETIKGSPIASHPNLKYIIAKFESALMENTPEYALAENFIAQVTPFKWDATVKTAINTVQESINSKAAVIEVQNTMHNIKATDSKRFFSDIVNRMNEWVYSEKKNVYDLIKEMKGYMFNPHVKDLANRLMLMENSKGTQFNIPVKDSNCSVSKIFSPVHTAVNGQVFRAGKNFYHATEGKLSKLSEEQINALPKEYLELCESFFNPSVKATDKGITIYVGKSKFDLTDDKRVFVNEHQIDATTLGSQLMFHTSQTIFRDSSNMANVVMNIYENMDNICEIDYGKAISSNVFEGVGVYLFRKDGKVFINKVNESMNENSFVEANALQTVKLVKEFLSFNMSESLAEFLEGDYKKKNLMEGEINKVLSNIQILEGELDKIEKAILEDPSFADVKEIAEAKTLIENELNGLKSKWQEMNSELKSFETIIEKEEDEAEEVETEEETPTEEPESTEEETPAEEPESTEETPAEEPEGVVSTDEAPAAPAVATGAVDTGLLGAEGVQAVATSIPGNDHPDANAGATAADSMSGTVVDTGFAGAEGTQQGETAGIHTSDAIKQEAPAAPVITPGQEAQVIPGTTDTSIPAQEAPAAPVEVPADTTGAVVTDVAADTAGETPAEVTPEKEEGDEEEKEESEESEEDEKKKSEVTENANPIITEAVGVDSKIKDKVSGKIGKVVSINDEIFSILFDDGETAERKLGDLDDADSEVEQNVENNEKPVDAEEVTDSNENEDADAAGEEGADDEKEPEAMFVTATLTLDLGPFKAGDTVEIDAANYTSVGDDDPIKLKEPKDGVTEVPKKYLKVEDGVQGGDGEAEGVDAKVAAVLQQIHDLETFLNDENTKGSKAIEAAKEKIKKFAESLGKQDEPKEETEETESK